MSVLGGSRFTALLAAVAISGMAGTFWWALETRSDIKASAGHQGAGRTQQPKFTGRVMRVKDERPGKSESGRFELMGNSERALPASVGAAGRSDRQDAAADGSLPLLANYQSPGSGLPGSSPPNPGFRSRSTQMPNLPIPDSSSLVAPGQVSPGQVAPGNVVAVNRADMPLPALPASPPARPAPAPWQAISQDSPTLLPALPFTPPSQPPENPKRQTRANIPAAPAAARVPKPQAPSYYMEQYLDQGEYRLRRRPCEPPNMPDVCFMPQASRQPVLAAKP